MALIVRSDEEIRRVWDAAQKAAFAAEDAGDTDDVAAALYDAFQWLTGNSDRDPAEALADEADDED